MSEPRQKITIETTVNAPLEKVWECFTEPNHVTQWNAASDDWHTPTATNDLRVGGEFNYRMEAKDKSLGFDFSGVYSEVVPMERFAYSLGDGREVQVVFEQTDGDVKLTETFDAEGENSIEKQKNGWQSILDRFKKYTEIVGV